MKMSTEVSSVEVKKVKKIVKKKKSVTIDDKIEIAGERRDSKTAVEAADKVPVVLPRNTTALGPPHKA